MDFEIKKHRKRIFILILLIVLLVGFNYSFRKYNFNKNFEIGQKLDSLNSVVVYYNGGVNNVTERNLTSDGYNLGLKYQCVEFVKRYYYEHYQHKMPDSYGHAKDFFNKSISDGELNEKRGLIQYGNPSKSRPQEGDLIVFSPSVLNRFGHVAIVSKVTGNDVEIIQQNPGPFGSTREIFNLNQTDKWEIDNKRILGWLRKE